MTLKIVPEAGFEHVVVHREKMTNVSEGKPEQEFWGSFGTILRISKYFKRLKQKFYFYYFFNFNAFKNIHLVTQCF